MARSHMCLFVGKVEWGRTGEERGMGGGGCPKGKTPKITKHPYKPGTSPHQWSAAAHVYYSRLGQIYHYQS